MKTRGSGEEPRVWVLRSKKRARLRSAGELDEAEFSEGGVAAVASPGFVAVVGVDEFPVFTELHHDQSEFLGFVVASLVENRFAVFHPDHSQEREDSFGGLASTQTRSFRR